MPWACIAYLDNGQVCGAPATRVDRHRGGVVCDQHAPAVLRLEETAQGFPAQITQSRVVCSRESEAHASARYRVETYDGIMLGIIRMDPHGYSLFPSTRLGLDPSVLRKLAHICAAVLDRHRTGGAAPRQQ